MKTKRFALLAILGLFSSFSFGQLRIYNSNLLKIGDVSVSPSINAGFEAVMSTLKLHTNNSGLMITPQYINIGGLVANTSIPNTISITNNNIQIEVKDAGIQISREEKVGYVPKGIPDLPLDSYVMGPITRLEGFSRPLMLGSGSNQLVGVYSTRFYSSSATGISSLSDIRYKTNILPIESSLSKILQINPVRFDYVKKELLPEKISDSTRSNKVGFIAQELIEIIPEAVDYDSYEDAYMVDYSVLIPFLVKALQEQQVEIERLKALLDKE